MTPSIASVEEVKNKDHYLYETWREMRKRCRDKNRREYPHYGGRGISVCERWSDFWKFVSDMGPRPDGSTLDRIDNDGNYEPSNCRWATAEEQGLNKRSRRMHLIEFGGLRLNGAAWARKFGLVPSSIFSRIRKYGEQKAIAMGPKMRGKPLDTAIDLARGAT